MLVWSDGQMIGWRKIILVLGLALTVTGAVHANMKRPCQGDTEGRLALYAGERTDSGPADLFQSCVFLAASHGLGPRCVGFLPNPQTDPGQKCKEQAVPPLTDGRGSLSLYLCGLISMGVFRSASSIRRLSLGAIPDWYHDAGPFQIGHSLAIGPDLHFAPVCCFVQPDCRTQDSLGPQYYRGIIASLLRKSQFIPTILASRGPPCLSHQ